MNFFSNILFSLSYITLSLELQHLFVRVIARQYHSHFSYKYAFSYEFTSIYIYIGGGSHENTPYMRILLTWEMRMNLNHSIGLELQHLFIRVIPLKKIQAQKKTKKNSDFFFEFLFFWSYITFSLELHHLFIRVIACKIHSHFSCKYAFSYELTFIYIYMCVCIYICVCARARCESQI